MVQCLKELFTIFQFKLCGGRVCLFDGYRTFYSLTYSITHTSLYIPTLLATQQKYDVVLVDTAGRMQDNEPLMRALAKLIRVNSSDLVLFVGEALVGNEAVDQLVKFNRALVDNSEEGNTRTIDGILLTKFDTIDDKVGT